MKKSMIKTVLSILFSINCCFCQPVDAKTGILVKACYDDRGREVIVSTGHAGLGDELFVIYDLHSMRVKHPGSVFMRISFDGWKTYRDVELKVNRDELPYVSDGYTGPLYSELKIPEQSGDAELYFFLTDSSKSVLDVIDNGGKFFRFSALENKELTRSQRSEKALFERLHKDLF